MNPYFNPYYLRNISSVQCIHNTTNDFEIKVIKEKYIIRLVDFYLYLLENVTDLEINLNVTCNTCDSNQLSAFDHHLVKRNDRNSNTRNNNPVLFMHLQHDTQIYNSTQNFS